LEPSVTPAPIPAVVRGLGPVIVLAAIVALVVARFDVVRDEKEFARLQIAATVSGKPGRLSRRPTAAQLFWKVENPDKAPRAERPREPEATETPDDAPF
jgi:hypothetical protein